MDHFFSIDRTKVSFLFVIKPPYLHMSCWIIFIYGLMNMKYNWKTNLFFKVWFQNRRAKARKQSHNSSSSGSTSLSSSVRLSSKAFSTNPTSSSFHQMFNGRGNASTSSPTSIMMATDPAASAAAAAAAFYSPFPPPPSSCDFNVRSTIVSEMKSIEKKF